MVAPSAIRNEHFLFVWVELLLKWYEEQQCYEYISLNYYIVLYRDTSNDISYTVHLMYAADIYLVVRGMNDIIH